ncbi:triphosphoribosyl-dephospho-CoA synthase CitG [Aerococcaceae bacterium WGS1372]
MSKSSSLDNHIPQLALKSLFYELSLSPKPGLVDRFNNGSHNDMNFYTFVDSALSFESFFYQYYFAGKELSTTTDFRNLFLRSRQIGIDAEEAMFNATGGINTHKGANFSLALILIATGYLVQRDNLPVWSKSNTDEMFNIIRYMTKDDLLKDFNNLDKKKKLTHGERLFVEHGITGIRGEAVSGYPILKDILMPYLRSQKDGLTEYTLLKALLLVMGNIEDGNIIHRGGFESWEYVKQQALNLYNESLDQDDFLNAMHKFDQDLIERHLSPGGAADAMSLGIFLYLLETTTKSL